MKHGSMSMNMETWKHVKHGNMETWKHEHNEGNRLMTRNFDIKHGNMEAWAYEHQEAARA
jgi:hypothetical protein